MKLILFLVVTEFPVSNRISDMKTIQKLAKVYSIYLVEILRFSCNGMER